MSEAPGESPPASEQKGPQLHDPPADGQGVDEVPNKQKDNASALKGLQSNPGGPLDDAVTEKFAKTAAKVDVVRDDDAAKDKEDGERKEEK